MLTAILQLVGILTLHTAAQQADVPLMRQMIEKKADVNAVDKKGATPLFYTANLGSVEAARLLLEHGANINQTVPGGGTPLHSALLKKHEDLSLFFIEQGANVNATTQPGVTPLHMAALNVMPNVVQKLLEHHADPNATTAIGQTPLLFAVQGLLLKKPGADTTIRLLLDGGAKPDKLLIEACFAKLSPEEAQAFAQTMIEAAGDEHPRIRSIVTPFLNPGSAASDGTQHSPLLGTLTQAEEDYLEKWWYSQPVEVPFWNGLKIPVVYEFDPALDPDFIQKADAALTAFLKKTAEDRLALTPLLREDCANACIHTDFTQEDIDSWLKPESGEGLWAALTPPEEIIIKRRHRRDKDIYLSMTMPCQWSDNMVFVYRQGRQLTRLSYADGWLTEADAFNTEDSEDPMLSSFEANK